MFNEFMVLVVISLFYLYVLIDRYRVMKEDDWNPIVKSLRLVAPSIGNSEKASLGTQLV